MHTLNLNRKYDQGYPYNSSSNNKKPELSSNPTNNKRKFEQYSEQYTNYNKRIKSDDTTQYFPNRYESNYPCNNKFERSSNPSSSCTKYFQTQPRSNDIHETYSNANIVKQYERNVKTEKDVIIVTISIIERLYKNINTIEKECKNIITNLLNNVRDSSIKLDTKIYNVAIKTYLKAGLFNEANELFKEMKRDKITPDVVTYNTLISNHAKKGEIKEVKRLWKEMEDNGILPNVIIHNSHVNAYVNAENLNSEEITKLKGFISYYAKKGEIKEVERLCEEMKKKRIPLDTFTLNLCIKVYVNAENLNSEEITKLKGFIEEIKNNNAPSDVVTYNTLISYFANKGNIKEVERLWKEMEDKGILPDVITWSLRIKVYVNAENLNSEELAKLKGFIEEIKNNNAPSDDVTYNILISYFAKKGEIKEVESLWEEMKKKGIPQNVIICNSLINGYVNAEKLTEAVAFIEEMKKKRIPPNVVTYNTLISYHAKKGDIKEVERLWKEMEDNGILLNAITWSLRIKTYVNAEKLTKAVAFIEEMRRKGVKPDAFIYNILISYFAKKGDIKEVEALWSKMEINNITPNFLIYNSIMEPYINNNIWEKVYALLKKGVKNNIFQDKLGYDVLKNTLNFHQNYCIKQIQNELHILSIPLYLSISILMYHINKGNINSQTKIIVGQHGVDIIKDGILKFINNNTIYNASINKSNHGELVLSKKLI